MFTFRVDFGNDWYDHHLGNASSAGILLNTTQTVSVNAPIPSSMIEGEYNLFVVLDEGDAVFEKNEEDNNYIHEEKMAIGSFLPHVIFKMTEARGLMLQMT